MKPHDYLEKEDRGGGEAQGTAMQKPSVGNKTIVHLTARC